MAIDPFFGGLVSAGANILGGVLGKNQSEENAKIAAQQAELNRKMQLEFAQKAIQWKVADAQAAGIHPLYALGASTQSYSPVSIGSTADNSLGEGLAKAGQDISRAMSANVDEEMRFLQISKAKLELEKAGLENDVLRSELASRVAKVSQAGTGPAIPLPTVAPAGAKLQKEQMTNQLRLFGKTLQNDPYTSDAQVAEDIMGEGVADWIWPFAKIPSLVWYNRGAREKFQVRERPGFRFGRN